jgi:glycosyltransferase involved in cell wall biosynthesis
VECLNSILYIERNINKEIVIIDDCSSDNSTEIISNWINEHKEEVNVIFKINKKNS